MYKTLLLAMALVTSGSCLWAQESLPGKDSPHTAANGQHARVEGCLQVEGGRYMVRDNSGIMHRLEGNNDKLSHYVGHDVELTGTRFTKTTDTTQEGTASTATERPDFRVESIKDVSDHCAGR